MTLNAGMIMNAKSGVTCVAPLLEYHKANEFQNISFFLSKTMEPMQISRLMPRIR